MMLMLFSYSAMALGLGEIRVLSGPGQPFVAEIPVISNTQGELENLRVHLASDDTFRRVGLPPPLGTVRNLQFQVSQDTQGRAVIRVTGSLPVNADSLGFLVEVDWGQGRLVREYSALVNAPQTAARIESPSIQGPAVGPSNTIARVVEPVIPPELPPPVVPENQAQTISPPPRREASPPPTRSPVSVAEDGSIQVRQGQTLSQIAAQTGIRGYTLNQTMLALLRANPNAFIDGNINRVRAGAVLRMPSPEQLAELNAAAAAALVQEQAVQWRQARQPIVQPAETGQARTGTERPAASAGSVADATNTPPPSDRTPSVDGARLEIAPAVPLDGLQAGNLSGTGEAGEGDMLVSEQLRQTREELVARESELLELHSRVNELEELRDRQQQLIELKDSQLATAEQKLREVNEQAGSNFPLWLAGGVILLLLALIAWLVSRWRKPMPIPTTAPRSFGAAPAQHELDTTLEPGAEYAEETDSDSQTGRFPGYSNESYQEVQDYADELVKSRPPVEGTISPGAGIPGDAAALHPVSGGRDRLELALAYLDLGDTETARDLLNEVARGDDPEMSEEARRRLQELG
ncbi:MAG: ferrous iron transporter B [Xanthomonadaceae bacterium]|nr:ferrous iron transporter B [Xanthomonadaceae bacterium]